MNIASSSTRITKREMSKDTPIAPRSPPWRISMHRTTTAMAGVCFVTPATPLVSASGAGPTNVQPLS